MQASLLRDLVEECETLLDQWSFDEYLASVSREITQQRADGKLSEAESITLLASMHQLQDDARTLGLLTTPLKVVLRLIAKLHETAYGIGTNRISGPG